MYNVHPHPFIKVQPSFNTNCLRNNSKMSSEQKDQETFYYLWMKEMCVFLIKIDPRGYTSQLRFSYFIICYLSMLSSSSRMS